MKPMHAVVSIVSMAVCAMVPAVSRAESGTAETIATSMRTVSTVQLGDTTVVAAAASGTYSVLKSSGGPLVEGLSAAVQCVQFAKKTATTIDLEADCAATFPGGDQLWFVFKRKNGDVVAGSTGEGRQEIVGGTGAFAGFKGQCRYKVDNIAADRNVTRSTCDWSR